MGIFKRRTGFFQKKKTFTADEFLFKYLEATGNEPSLAQDGSAAVIEYIYEVPLGKNAWMYRLTMASYNAGINPDNFFGVPALTNGLKFEVKDIDDNLLVDFTNGRPIKTVMELANFAGSDAGTLIDRPGVGNDGAAIRWTFAKAGEPLFLQEGSKFIVTVQDDLLAIDFLRVMIQGLIVDKF